VYKFSEAYQRPELTVAVCTYNRWESCREAVRSILYQSKPVVCLVVDDCSSVDPPRDFLGFLNENNVIYIRLKKNSGLAAARNMAIRMARTKYISFCDDDDLWPNGLALAMLREIHGCLYKNFVICYDARLEKRCSRRIHRLTSLSDLFYAGCTPPVSAQMYRLDLLRKVGGYGYVTSGVDHDLWVRLLEVNPTGRIVFADSPKTSSCLHGRMTMIEERRRIGVDTALSSWKEMLVTKLGEDFFDHFARSYSQHLDLKFFLRLVKLKEATLAFKYCINRKCFKILIFFILKKIALQSNCCKFTKFR